MESWRRHLSLLSRCNTQESLEHTSNMIFPVELRSNTFEFDTIISLWLILDDSTKKFLRPVIIFTRSRFWGNRRKPFAVFLAKLGTDIRVESYAYTVQFVPLFKFRSFTTVINIMSPSMEPYRMSRRIDLEPGTSYNYFRFFYIDELR